MSSSIEAKSPEACCSIRMTKSQASKLGIGERVGITVRGEVKGIREAYDDKEMYDVDLKSTTVSSISSDNVADKSLKKLEE